MNVNKWPGIHIWGFVIYRAGYPSRLYPPEKRGRWWVWVGPYLIGWPDETW